MYITDLKSFLDFHKEVVLDLEGNGSDKCIGLYYSKNKDKREYEYYLGYSDYEEYCQYDNNHYCSEIVIDENFDCYGDFELKIKLLENNKYLLSIELEGFKMLNAEKVFDITYDFERVLDNIFYVILMLVNKNRKINQEASYIVRNKFKESKKGLIDFLKSYFSEECYYTDDDNTSITLYLNLLDFEINKISFFEEEGINAFDNETITVLYLFLTEEDLKHIETLI